MAQPILSVGKGGFLHMAPGSTLHLDDLTLAPSVSFVLSEQVTIERLDAAQTPGASPHMKRAYRFANLAGLFTGKISVGYDDSETNNFAEHKLHLHLHNGNRWNHYDSNANDTYENIVHTDGLQNIRLNELTLSPGFETFTHTWGQLTAFRDDKIVVVEWTNFAEIAVDHYEVERSEDLTNWSTILDAIGAKNRSSVEVYVQKDNQFNPRKLYYRIKQVEKDARFAYSPVVPVQELESEKTYSLFPNPAASYFFVKGNTFNIRQISIYNNSGILAKRWLGNHVFYNVLSLASGQYVIELITKDGKKETFKLVKQ